MKWKTIEKALCLALVFTVLLSFTGFAAQCESIPDAVLRLHVLANSDSEEDQALKLKVRDRILQESAGMLDCVSDKALAIAAVKERLPQLTAAAQDEINRQGYTYSVHLEITSMYFTTREYEQVTLPAGQYDALRVSIGEAKGRNWWCVLFPPMCLPAAEEPQELEDVLNSEQMQIVDGQNRYEVRFKVLEWYEKLCGWLQGK